MECPFCDGIAKIIVERKKISYRKEEFEIQQQFFKCEKCSQEFTNTAVDQVNILQVYNQYRVKYDIPFPQELQAVRKKYALSYSLISKLLGFGVNQYRNYENGELPNQSNGTLLSLIRSAIGFKKILENKRNLIPVNKYQCLISHLDKLIIVENDKEFTLTNYLLMKFNSPSEYTGYAVTSFEKFFNMILFFIHNAFYRLRLNKFMFYADFLNFKKTGCSISGVPYAAITNGPVAEDYNALFSLAEEMGYITEVETILPGGDSGEKFIGLKNFDTMIFNEAELNSMKDVLNKFQYVKTEDLKKMSHEELGWKKNKDKCGLISYQDYAFLLKHI